MERRHEVLFEQLNTYRSELLGVVEDITAEEADIVPEGFNNNIRWNLGHVLLDQYLWIHALTKEDIPIPLKFNEWFGFGTNPSHFTEGTPSLGELTKLLRQQPQLIREQNENRMEQPFPPTGMGMHTIEQVLVRTIFHEGMHLGAILAIKRQLRKLSR
ncbi:formate dehydrogenase [Paenibacillus macerans]|nr:formate dehydrogenase [Paenibacillus macerans]